MYHQYVDEEAQPNPTLLLSVFFVEFTLITTFSLS
jgi:hypothetical protein